MMAGGSRPAAGTTSARLLAGWSPESGEHVADQRDHFSAVELDAAHQLLVRQRAGAILHVEAGDAEDLRGRGDLTSDRLRRAAVQRAPIGFLVELRAADRTPS